MTGHKGFETLFQGAILDPYLQVVVVAAAVMEGVGEAGAVEVTSSPR